MMRGIVRSVSGRVVPALRGATISQRANLYTKPAKDKLGAAETAVGLGMFAFAILGPSGWILAHLDDYKKKE
ncbi:cytochrome c oxidase subunit 8A, mitochondrial [Lampris incognitus]|uniref:cytochrome c oxidase subunit 8A, mitochondrial n=1 Tax=Lampris incognitus TaxID=2546036 RepID=UPI0024B60CE4|nr:cytochrome c oxidase subunit 8A, mitochondrial [Lampris incognitus]